MGLLSTDDDRGASKTKFATGKWVRKVPLSHNYTTKIILIVKRFDPGYATKVATFVASVI
jgi:hypothetical protein